jgi:indole-3-glycerol phosphate synthase
MKQTGTVLDRILDQKAEHVQRLKRNLDPAQLWDLAQAAGPPRDFLGALARTDGPAVIAEIKKASPSAGALRHDVDPAAWAERYQRAGAAALSVLTDRPFFGGSLEDLIAARSAVDLPVLRKDFIIDPVQLLEARAAGADAVLLIAAALETPLLADLFRQARELHLTPLVEVHHRDELDAALALDPPLLGVNNRDLKTLTVSLRTALDLGRLIPNETLAVAESGLEGPEDVVRLESAGYRAFLIGSSLMKAADPEAKLRTIRSGRRAA